MEHPLAPLCPDIVRAQPFHVASPLTLLYPSFLTIQLGEWGCCELPSWVWDPQPTLFWEEVTAKAKIPLI